MGNKRQLGIFLLICIVILLIWTVFVLPKFIVKSQMQIYQKGKKGYRDSLSP